MFKDSDSPQNAFNSLSAWLRLPETQEALAALKEEGDSLNQVLLQLVPKRELGHLLGDMFHREQSIGEIRGLTRLDALCQQRLIELDHIINPRKEDPDADSPFPT